MSKKSGQIKYADIRPWVKTGVAEEDAKPLNPIWKGEPSEGASIFRSTKSGRQIPNILESTPVSDHDNQQQKRAEEGVDQAVSKSRDDPTADQGSPFRNTSGAQSCAVKDPVFPQHRLQLDERH
jgi:hypothetical protein